jgi:hypothetical protein
MKAVKIQDMEPERRVLAVDLRHVLLALGQRARASTWRARDVWATGEATSAIESLDEKQTIPGTRLLELAENVVQIIDGVFSAFDPDSAGPWVIIEAVDSTFYAVHSDDETVLDSIRHAFHEVSDHAEPVF